MPDTGDALSRAVLADPADDTPRLALADWYDETGRPDRAEFVRTQVALAEVPEHHPRWAAARRRGDVFLDGTPFLGDLPPLPDGLGWGRPAFRRGFPWKLAVTDPHAFARHAPAAFAVAPVEGLEVDGRFRPELGPLLTSPSLVRIRTLRFVNWPFRPRELIELADTPYIRQLAHVRFEFSSDSDDWGSDWMTAAVRLIQSRWFPQLESLAIRGPDAVWFVTLPGRLPSLAVSTLDLADSSVTLNELAVAVRHPSLPALSELRLDRTTLVRQADSRWFFDVPEADRLAAMYLSDQRGYPLDLAALAASPHLANLRGLGVRRCGVGRQELNRLLDSSAVAGLTFLDLSGNLLGDRGAEAVAGAAALADVAELRLMACGMSDRGGRALAAAPRLDSVLNLDLSGNPFRPATRQALVERFGDRVTFS